MPSDTPIVRALLSVGAAPGDTAIDVEVTVAAAIDDDHVRRRGVSILLRRADQTEHWTWKIEFSDDQGAIQLAVRASDMPPGGYVSSKVRHCSRCGARVRISDTSFPLADRLTIVCMVCFEAEWSSELP